MERMRRLGVLAVPLLILLAGAVPAFAQGGQGNGTLVGTVVDNVGVIPGATVTATHVATNTNRTGTTNEQGEFRLVSLVPGRYTLKIEMDGFRPVTVAEFSLLGGEIRALGRMTLTAGGVTESVTITAEVTPVQTANSALSRNITGDTLVMVQVKGRDVFGMMKILPGVMDSHASRDYAQWNSGRYLSINGGDSLNKNTTIDGVPVGEEGGSGTTYVTPNIDSIGEVNVITSGYNAEHGRQSSGLVQITTKSGTNQFRGSGWTNLRRDEWNKNDFFRIQSNSPKPFFEVNIGGYSIGGPIIIPKVVDSRTSDNKFYFFASQEFTEDVRPTAITRTNLPTAAELNGDFSQTTFGKATLQPDGSVSGTTSLQLINDPLTGQQFPGNVIPSNRINPMGQALLMLSPLPNGQRDSTTNAYNNSNDAQDLQPRHTRSNFITRVDAVFGSNTRASVRALFDRDDAISPNNIAPGIGEINNNFPGNLINGTMTKVLSPSMVNETIIGYSWNHWGHRVGTGAENSSNYTQWWQPNVTNPLTGQTGPVPAAPRSVWRVWRARPEEREQGRVAVSARAALHGRRPHEPAPDASVRLQRPAAEMEPEPALHGRRTTSPTRGVGTTSSSAWKWSATPRPSRARRTTPGSTTSATTRRTRLARTTATPTRCSASSRATPNATTASTARTGTGMAGSTRRTAGA